MRTLAVAVVGVLVAAAAPAGAEIVVLRTGRTLSVKAVQVDGAGRAVLTLRGGGEIVCESALILRVDPDEIPWPAAPSLAEAVAPTAARPGAPPPFADLIEPLAQRYGVEAALVRAVVETESAFEPRARSPKGAMGLMQLMPDTARLYAVADPYEPRSNLDAGIRHLKFLLDRYDTRIALAAYNAGEGAVRRHGGVPPYRETRDYVDRVLRRLEQHRRTGIPSPPAGGRPPLASPTS
jgi:hypothetical protein